MNTTRNMSNRDELIGFATAEGVSPWVAEELADRILEAGYRKYRTVSTTNELDALPFGAAIMNPRTGRIHQHISTPRARFPWRSIDGHVTTTHRLVTGGPYIVLTIGRPT